MTDREKTVRCIVSGRVQDVFYRATTADRARGLGLRGWASNLADGTVEVVVCGAEASVAALCAWLWEGPPAARVTGVRVEEWSGSPGEGFSVRQAQEGIFLP